MFVGLGVTAAIAYVVQSNERLLEFAANNLFVLILAQLGLVFAIGLGIRRISATVALGLFFVYAASLGVTIGLIVSAYTQASVVSAFLSSSAMFGAAAIYGHVTKRSLARMGSLLFMGLIGLLVAMVINLFLRSDVALVRDLDHRRRHLHRADGVGRPAHPERPTGRLRQARSRRPRSWAR